MNPTASALAGELTFTAARSSGPGGQNVNKVNSKVFLRWDVKNSTLITEEQRQLLLNKLTSRLTTEGIFVLSAQEKRSQLQNREAVIQKFDELLQKAFKPRKTRKKTKPTKASKVKRVDNKKKQSEKKQWRRKL